MRVLRDRKQGEGELRTRYFLLRVLVPSFKARQSADPHHHETVSDGKGHRRCLRWDFHRDTEAAHHHIDGRLVARVQAGHHTRINDLLRLVNAKLALSDDAVAWEHAGGDTESEVGLHNFSF